MQGLRRSGSQQARLTALRPATIAGARDPFGLDPEFRLRVLPAVRWLYRKYWRVTVDGIENIPSNGPALIVANHSGGIPFDAIMLAAALEFEHPQPRALRFLYDRFVDAMPLMADAYRALGAATANYENGLKLLRREDVVGIFPEGVDGIGKGIAHRYQLQRFRTGFVRMSLELQAPIVPVVVVGAEETYPVIGRWKPTGWMKNFLNVPFVPLTPLFPLLGPLGALPLPTHWRLHFGKPVCLWEKAGARKGRTADYALLANQVRRSMQRMLNEAIAERETLFR